MLYCKTNNEIHTQENILNRMHFHLTEDDDENNNDMCTSAHCITHRKFGMTVVEQYVCPCGATSEPSSYVELVHYVSATALWYVQVDVFSCNFYKKISLFHITCNTYIREK